MSAVTITPRFNDPPVQNEVVEPSKPHTPTSTMMSMAYENRWIIAAIVITILIIIFVAWWLRSKEETTDPTTKKGKSNTQSPQGKDPGKDSPPDKSQPTQPTQPTQQPAQTTQVPQPTQTTQQTAPPQFTQPNNQQQTSQFTPQNNQQQNNQQSQPPQFAQQTQQPQNTQQPQQPQNTQQYQPPANTQANSPIQGGNMPATKSDYLSLLQQINTPPAAVVQPNSKADDEILQLMEDAVDETQNSVVIEEVDQNKTCGEITAQGNACRNRVRSNGRCHLHGG